MSMIKVKAVALHRKGKTPELHEESCAGTFKRGWRPVHRTLLLETKAEVKDLREEFTVHDCFVKATQRKRGRSVKNPNRSAANPPKSARFYKLLLEGGTENLLVLGWYRGDGMFCCWLVHPNGKYVLHPVAKEDHRTFLLLAASDIKRKQRMVMDTRRHTLQFPKAAIMMSMQDAKETGHRNKRESYVSKKLDRKAATRARRKASRPAPEPEVHEDEPAPTKRPTKARRSTVGERIVAIGVNQETGTVTQVLDLSVNGASKDKALKGLKTRWAVQCVDHGVAVEAEGKREAKKMKAHPTGWCSECKKG